MTTADILDALARQCHAAGRALHRPEITLSVTEEGATLRADCSRNSKVWFEAHLGVEVLAGLLALAGGVDAYGDGIDADEDTYALTDD